MKYVLMFFGLFSLTPALFAQKKVYTIQADSVKITNCDSAELIIENHTQGTKGFLYNTGQGRTIFKKGVERLSDTSWLIGGDTLHAASWLQGGNRFGDTGRLGTIDNYPLKLYTAGMERASISSSGSASFKGNVSIGTATITTAGNLINTDAILFKHFIPAMHNYSPNSPYIGRLENVLYNLNLRLNTTQTFDPDGTQHIHIVFPLDELVDSNGIAYAVGWMYFSFWANGVPQSVTISEKDKYGNWTTPATGTTNLGLDAGLFPVRVTLNNWLREIQITITPKPGGGVNLQNIEYVLDIDQEGLSNPNPYVSKYGNEHLYYYLYLKNGGVDNIRLSPFPSAASYFKNNLLVGTDFDNEYGKLQVAGNITATGRLGLGTASPSAQLHTTGSLRFEGLINENAFTHVLVADTNGYVYYRNASTLAMDDVVHSSLAVNGPIKAKSVTIEAATAWPDYVFDSSYQLPDLAAVERDLRQLHHLPGVPSAKDISKNGINVGDSYAIFLQKIEELTLYAIEQKNEASRQSKVNEVLNRRLVSQEEELQALKKEMMEIKKTLNKK